MKGQKDLEEVYKRYEAYISGSTSEGFGLTLMEAVGSGLPIIGFDVRYGNQNFIDDGQNGYKIPVHDRMEKKERVEELARRIILLFKESDLEAFHQHSYEKAKGMDSFSDLYIMHRVRNASGSLSAIGTHCSILTP